MEILQPFSLVPFPTLSLVVLSSHQQRQTHLLQPRHCRKTLTRQVVPPTTTASNSDSSSSGFGSLSYYDMSNVFLDVVGESILVYMSHRLTTFSYSGGISSIKLQSAVSPPRTTVQGSLGQTPSYVTL